ncbi:unnamed protein product [Prunus armeniaca]
MLLIRAGLGMPVLDWTVNNFNCQVSAGLLSYGTVIAVKHSKSKQGNCELVNEIGLISTMEHPHLFKLHGCCIKGNQLLLVYEYMENNSLARALFGKYYSCMPKLRDSVKESGIVAQYTTPRTPQQNGVAERRNITLKDMGCPAEARIYNLVEKKLDARTTSSFFITLVPNTRTHARSIQSIKLIA